MRLTASVLTCVAAFAASAAQPQPKPFVQLKVNGAAVKDGAQIPGRPGERLSLEAKVFGGRRAWCMEPQRYANMGRNTVIESSGEDGLSFTTGPGFRGIWKLQSESATWWGQLTGETRAAPGKRTAELTIPARPGRYQLRVKAIATWHYDRYSQGNHVEQVEKMEAEGNYTVVVEQAGGVWFSSANIVASGTPDDDLRFRLQSLQQKFDLISQQLLDGQVALAEANLGGVKETLDTMRRRVEQLKKDTPGATVDITFIGSPGDKVMKRVAALKAMATHWSNAHKLVTGNAQEVNRLLLNKQMLFTNNVLKSVFKNYLDWGSGIPNPNDLFGAVPVKLQALVIPSNVMDWYGNAQEDSSILRNQVLAIRRMNQLRDFYLQRGPEFIAESRKIHQALDAAKPAQALDARARALLSGCGFARWKPGS